MVIAGPGSGKTAVLTNRIKYLIEERNIPPEQILTITFSKKAAEGMQKRFLDLCEDTGYPVTFGTFHSVFFHIINKQYHYTTGNIATLRDKRNAMEQAVKRTGILNDPEAELIDSLLKDTAYYKNCNERIHISSDTNLTEEQFKKIYSAYRDIQIATHKIDFEDMLLIVRNLLNNDKEVLEEYRAKYRYILIDEYQDINDIQFDIVKMLAAPDNNLFVVGDDDQSIYGFRGSRSEIMLGFNDTYPNAVNICLTVNYRCSENVIKAAGLVIAENRIRYDKKITGTGMRAGEVTLKAFPDIASEDEWIAETLRKNIDKELAVFLRTNREASRYAEICRNNGVPCDMKEAVYNPYKGYAYKDIYHYLCLADIVAGSIGAENEEVRTRSTRAGMVRAERVIKVRRTMLPVAHLFPVMNKPLRYLNRKNIMCNEVSIEGLKDIYCDKPYMDKVMNTFADQLLNMCDMDLYARVNYIRKGIDYDTYVMNNLAQTKEEFDDYMDTADWIQERAADFRDVAELNRYADEYEDMMKKDATSAEDEECNVHIMTYHASKGLEFDTVILPHLNEGSVPHKRTAGEVQTEEERRMLYVAMTRAENDLYMTYVAGDKDKKHLPSRFLKPLLPLFQRTNVVKSNGMK